MLSLGLFLAGWFGQKSSSSEDSSSDQWKVDLMNQLTTDAFSTDSAKQDLKKVDGSKIKAFLTEYASAPHMAGWAEFLHYHCSNIYHFASFYKTS